MLKDIVALARPHQYIKNFFVFLPAFFAFKLHEPRVLLDAGVVFIAFCLTASSVYILNDWQDRADDRKHPEKQFRPLASGRVTAFQAFSTLASFLLGGVLLAATSGSAVISLLAIYFLLNLAYSYKLKHQPIIDITCISIGFVLRLFAGAAATGVNLSHWIIVMTFLLALFLALAKRRDDVVLCNTTGQQARKVIDGYNLKFLDAAMVMTASIVVLAYILWSISPTVTAKLSSSYTFLTAIFVVLGILRYMQISFVEEKSGSPTKVLLRDRFVQMTLVGWLGSFVWILYI
jgi:4-hydroxybenzoate polyprenyltransferase